MRTGGRGGWGGAGYNGVIMTASWYIIAPPGERLSENDSFSRATDSGGNWNKKSGVNER